MRIAGAARSSDDVAMPAAWVGAPRRGALKVNRSALAPRLAAVVLAVTLAGCSSTSMVNVRQDSNATLQIWIRQIPGSPTAKTAQRLVRAFSRQTGVKARLVSLYDDFETKL